MLKNSPTDAPGGADGRPGLTMGAHMLSKPIAQPKPEPAKRTKGRKIRTETSIKQRVRAIVANRDGECRLRGKGLGVCGGESEWCHLEEKRRARTRKMPPEIRHTTQDSAMLCTVHHQRYDANEIAAEYVTPEKADGRMAWHTRETRYLEAAR